MLTFLFRRLMAGLFRRLTAEQPRGAPLFAAVTAEARKPHWYVEGQVPDTIDGRFAMLATIAALALVRLERDGEPGNLASVALTERFIDVMKTEHRELGLGDPALGKKVRKLVGSLAGRVELWRRAAAAEVEWLEATQRSVYKDQVSPDPLAHTAAALGKIWARLERLGLGALIEGKLE
jgi:cytochrome b pre-mRNA-processing protein 3